MRIPGADKAVANLVKWSAGDKWGPMLEQIFAEHFDEICEDFVMTNEEITDALGDSFVMIYGWVLEDFFTVEFDDGVNVIDDYLKRRGWREKVPAKRYLQALRDSTFSLYEAVDIDPGRSITVRDLIFGGDAVRVNEVSGSQMVRQWDRVAARIVTVNNKIYFTGSLLPFQPEAAKTLLTTIDSATKKLGKTLRREAKKQGEPADFKDADLKKFVVETSARLFTEIWLTDALERLAAPLPELRNSDGHEIVFSEVAFPILGELSKVAASIGEIGDFEPESPEEQQWVWLQSGAPHEMPSQDDGLTIISDDLSGNTILGNLEIEGDRLVLNTNSRERAERGREILSSHLGESIGQPLTSLQTLEQLREAPARPSVAQDELPPEIAEQAISSYFDGHYRQTLDQPLPALGGKTPRQAAKTKKGREAVIDWLKLLENSEAHRAASQGQQPYDFLWMWEELKVADLR